MGAVDPFHEMVRGSKIPDDQTFPSVAMTSSFRVTPTTSADGSFARAFTYAPARAESGASVTSGTITWSDSAIPITNFTNVSSTFHLFRTVSYGIRISTITSLVNATGLLYIALIPDDYVGTLSSDWPTTADQFAQSLWHMVVPIAKLVDEPLVIAGKRTDNGSYRYRPIGTVPANVTTNSVEGSSGWSSIMVYAAGAPASTVPILIEYVSNLECIPTSRGLVPGLASTVSPVDRPQIDAAKCVDAAAPVGFFENFVDAGVRTATLALEEGKRILAPLAPGLRSLATRAVASQVSRFVTGDLRGALAHPQSFVALKNEEEKSWTRI
jgi:hypothetical protein